MTESADRTAPFFNSICCQTGTKRAGILSLLRMFFPFFRQQSNFFSISYLSKNRMDKPFLNVIKKLFKKYGFVRVFVRVLS